MVVAASPNRAGRKIRQPEGYESYIPELLPPKPDIDVDPEMTLLLAGAAMALGRLDGIARTLPDPDLFVAMYVRREAVLSSQIEGTESTLDDVLRFEAGATTTSLSEDVGEVVNYVNAMNYGLRRLESLPISSRLLREIHLRLMHGARGGEKAPGEIRTCQNWIGALGPRGLNDAVYVPPPAQELSRLLGNLESYLHDHPRHTTLLACAIAHSQFETVHPFLDGNGRMGRLLITFQLCHEGVLARPLLCLSHYFKLHRRQYYDRLMAVRFEGDWEGWLKFFLKGVALVSDEASNTAIRIVALREEARNRATAELGGSAGKACLVIEHLCRSPLVTVNEIVELLGVSFGTANQLVAGLERLSLLSEITGGRRNRVYQFEPYLELFRDAEAEEEI